MKPEQELSREHIFDGTVFKVDKLEVKTKDGYIQDRELVLHNGGASIVALNDKGEVYLVRQYRTALDAETLEIPAGRLEKGEEPRDCAIRELEEECALKAEDVSLLSQMNPTPGYSNEIINIFFADKFVKTEQNLDEGEFVNVEKYPLDEAINMAVSGEITDAKTIVGLFLAKEKLKTK